MYHRIGRGSVPREPGEEIYAVQEEAFRAQMQHLRDCGRPVVDLHQLVDAPTSAPGAVALTFDDGNHSDATVAAPTLARLGLQGTFFVTPAWIGRPGFMDWPDVRELVRMGMTVGAHGLDHTPLSSLSNPDLGRHLREARRELGSRLGSDPLALSMPGGAGGHRVLQAAREEGFRIVAGSLPRRFRPRGSDGIVPRFAIRRADSAAFFGALVEQRPGALSIALGRHALLHVLRRVLGEGLYQRLRMHWNQAGPS
jgi:peptidoglycan/xylan/chitin deacetylase (PgdA/CDA1 family)